jgi:hypothetical protein
VALRAQQGLNASQRRAVAQALTRSVTLWQVRDDAMRCDVRLCCDRM